MKSEGAKSPILTVIIPSWNARHFIGECLESLRSQSLEGIKVVVVENGSTDGSPEYIESNYPEVTLLRQSKNTGFAKAVNIGIRHSRTKFVALLNNDAIADGHWAKKLVERLETDLSVGAAVSKILKQERTDSAQRIIDTTGDQYSIWGLPFPRGRDEVDEGQYDTSEEVFAACGGSVAFRKSILHNVGLFDEDFFAYYEDVDISCRLRRAGYKIVYEPSSVVYHKVGGTSGGGKKPFTRFHSTKNLWYLYLKEMPGIYFWIHLPRFILIQVPLLASSLKHGLIVAHLKGVLYAVLLTPKMLAKRWKINSHSRITSRDFNILLYGKIPPMQKKGIYKLLAKIGFK